MAAQVTAGYVDYSAWHRHLHDRGFRNVWYAADTFGPSTARYGKWSKGMRHSAWARPSRMNRKDGGGGGGIGEDGEVIDECRAHVARTGRPVSELDCLPLRKPVGSPVDDHHVDAASTPLLQPPRAKHAVSTPDARPSPIQTTSTPPPTTSGLV